ncbi:hypothetical protein FLM9_1161 [Candidatus Synechococcus spongiarum]|uniref:Uncharacterized protein n=1 Tax=Candidatus Synechococcus spongiarum TaxID=431041 RepID=A0A164ZRY4_9SYNE|nr:hypothetical protein FLM9_1161 [Candidatus Synechococcus spongiarum]
MVGRCLASPDPALGLISKHLPLQSSGHGLKWFAVIIESWNRTLPGCSV